MDELWNRPVTLSGNAVRLEPLRLEHVPALAEAGRDKEIWRFMVYGDLSGEERMRAWVEELLRRQAGGTDLPFAVIQRESGRMAGATRYLEMRPADRGLEIGGTWYGSEFQRTRVNSECKLLLLTYAFETLGCIRVQFKADARNERSLRAIERLGAVKEGVLRQHMILEDGTVRDSVYYSILEKEWPGVKRGLEARLRRQA